MNKEIHPVIVVVVLIVIVAVIGGLWWRSSRPNVIEKPRVTMPTIPTGQ